MALDVGQAFDPSAVSVLEYTTRARAQALFYQTPEDQRDGLVVPQNDWFAPNGHQLAPNALCRADVRYLARLPLKMSYPDQARHIA